MTEQTDTPQTPPDGGTGTPIPPSGGPASPPAAAPPEVWSQHAGQPAAAGGESDGDGPATFDRGYVEKLRQENAAARVKAKRADTLGGALVTAYAAATGRLADATDLPYSPDLCDEDGVPDEQKVRASVDALLERKPHLASRRPAGDVGQGARPAEADGVSLAGLLRAGAG